MSAVVAPSSSVAASATSTTMTASGPMLLCASCRHAFPATALTRAAFDEAVATHMTRAQSLLHALVGRDAAEAHTVQQLSLELQQLCGVVHDHTRALHTRLDALTSSSLSSSSPLPHTTSSSSGGNNSNAMSRRRSDGRRRNSHQQTQQLQLQTSQQPRRRSDAGAVVVAAAEGGGGDDEGCTHAQQQTTTATTTSARRGRGRSDSNHGTSLSLPAHTTTTAAAAAATTTTSNATALSRSSVRFDDANHTAFAGTVPPFLLRHAHSAFDLISASIYCLCESAAVQTRAEVALLWLRPRGLVSTELIAPFVVGRDVSALRDAAPFRVPESSLPCMVSATGVAANLRPRRDDGRDDDGDKDVGNNNSGNNGSSGKTTALREGVTATPLTVPQLLECEAAAQLLMPVFTRYHTAGTGRRVLAVLHLIGSPDVPCAFRRRNEETALQASLFLSHLLSAHHDTMISEWLNRFYNPSRLQRTSTYNGSLDLRPHAKCVDDFDSTPVLIYRGGGDGDADNEEDNEEDDKHKGNKEEVVLVSAADEAVVDADKRNEHDVMGNARRGQQHTSRSGCGSGRRTTRRARHATSAARHGDSRPRSSSGGRSELVKDLRHAITRKATVLRAATGIRDLYRYATNLERYWIAAVDTTTRLQNTLGEREAAAIREEVQRLRQQRDAATAMTGVPTRSDAVLAGANNNNNSGGNAATTAAAAHVVAMTARASMRAAAASPNANAAAAPLLATTMSTTMSHGQTMRRLSASLASSSSSSHAMQLPAVALPHHHHGGSHGHKSNTSSAEQSGGTAAAAAATARRNSASLLQQQQQQQGRRGSTRVTRTLSSTTSSVLEQLPQLTPAMTMVQDAPMMRATPVLKPEEVQQLEGAAMKRLQQLGVNADVFATRDDGCS